MSMHLLGPWYTTTRYRSNSSTPRSSAKSDEHQKWLTKRGLNPKQISQKKTALFGTFWLVIVSLNMAKEKSAAVLNEKNMLTLFFIKK